MARSLSEIVDEHLADANRLRSSTPPLPVDSGGFVETPRPMSQSTEAFERRNVFESAFHALGLVAKQTIRPLTFAADHLDRTDTLFRGAVLTAFGRMDAEKYPDFWRQAREGKVRISGDAFNEMAFGERLSHELEGIKILPDWVKKVASPLATLAGRDPREDPTTLGAVLGLGAELFVSPWTALAALPRNAFRGTRLAQAANKAGLNPATSPLTFPLRRATAAALSSENPFGHMLMQLRPPVGALANHKELLDSFVGDVAELQARGNRLGNKMIEISRKHTASDGFLGSPAGRRVGLSQDELADVWEDLFVRDVKLTDAQAALRDDLMSEVVMPLHKQLKDMGYDRVELGVRPGQTNLVSPGRTTGRSLRRKKTTKTRIWDPERDKMRHFVPSIANMRQQLTPPGEKNFLSKMETTLPWNKGQKLPYNVFALRKDQMNPLHAIEQWASAAEQRLVYHARNRQLNGQWENTGILEKFAPTHPSSAKNSNKALKTMTDNEYGYWVQKVHDLTGHRAGRVEIRLSNTMARMFDQIERNVDSLAQRNRIAAHFQAKVFRPLNPGGFPAISNASAVTGILTHNIVIATLGGNLSSALKNSSQALNTATKAGTPAMFRGLFKMADFWSDEGKTLRALRREADFGNEYRRLASDEVFARVGTSFDNLVMSPFNATENFMRGLSFNVKASEKMRKLNMTKLSDLDDAGKISQVVREGRLEALDTNFVYGIAGRSQLMMSPIAKMGFALQSYGINETEFLVRTFRRDGSAMLRHIGLHGWAIDMGDKLAGVNSENWLGWGFLPPETMGRGPIFDSMQRMMRLSIAVAENDSKSVKREVDGLKNGINEIFRAFGLEQDTVPEEMQAIMGGATLAGLAPVPLVGVARTAKFFNEFTTGIRETQGGKTFQVVSRAEAAAAWFSTTHRQFEDQRLRDMESRLRTKVSGDLDKRVRKFVTALRGRDGTEVMLAARDLHKIIPVKFPATHALRGPRTPLTPLGAAGVAGGALSLFAGEERGFWPHPEMIQRRIDNQIRRATTSRDVLEMNESGWTKEILWAEYVRRAQLEFDRGAIRALRSQ